MRLTNAGSGMDWAGHRECFGHDRFGEVVDMQDFPAVASTAIGLGRRSARDDGARTRTLRSNLPKARTLETLAVALAGLLALGIASPPLDDAERLLAAGEYRRAQDIAGRASAADPNDSRAHFVFAKASLALVEPAFAASAFERALHLEPRLKEHVGPAYLEEARRLYAEVGSRRAHSPVIRAYLDAAERFGFPSTPETDKWVADVRQSMMPSEPQAAGVSAASETDLNVQAQRHRDTMIKMRSLAIAIEAFGVDYNIYPEVGDLSRLRELLKPYIPSFPATDEWGTPFRFETSPDRRTYRISSAAADRIFDPQRPLQPVPPSIEWCGPTKYPVKNETPAGDITFVCGDFAQAWRPFL